jgi:hypothetical protein
MKSAMRPLSRFNGQWWADQMVREVALAQLKTYEECVLGRILPSFNTLHDEVLEKGKALFESMELPPDADPGDAAEWANDKALSWGENVGGIYMGTVALLTVGLFHFFEQHSALLCREAGLGKIQRKTDFGKHLRSVGVDVQEFPGWAKLNEELRAVANVVKHAEGDAAETLRALRPDLFTLPSMRSTGLRFELNLPVDHPLTGDGIYVTEDDFKFYAAIVRDFWEWLARRFETLGASTPLRSG